MLSTLDPGLCIRIVSYLNPADIYNYIQVNQESKSLGLDEYIWKNITKKNFPLIDNNFLPNDNLWRAEYKERVEAARRQVRKILYPILYIFLYILFTIDPKHTSFFVD